MKELLPPTFRLCILMEYIPQELWLQKPACGTAANSPPWPQQLEKGRPRPRRADESPPTHPRGICFSYWGQTSVCLTATLAIGTTEAEGCHLCSRIEQRRRKEGSFLTTETEDSDSAGPLGYRSESIPSNPDTLFC